MATISMRLGSIRPDSGLNFGEPREAASRVVGLGSSLLGGPYDVVEVGEPEPQLTEVFSGALKLPSPATCRSDEPPNLTSTPRGYMTSPSRYPYPLWEWTEELS